ncbi:universal stress protein [Rhizobium sp. P40RR-XXII]|uniref:universal stress protein n=1 Tax=Rhizobium sp. P40RR-XXII TaxID=2726739 RepID=UPI001457903D|nr:universal stress protein [Rhizobium sp. P40RR-XXII]NLS20396.1 universal stress protein [Rhizobium sp. P40RR-XXII]
MFKKILIATDGSSHAQTAVEIGADLVEKGDGEVHLVHVILSGELDTNIERMIKIEHLDDLVMTVDEPTAPFVVAPGLPMVPPLADPVASYRMLHALGVEILKRAESVVRAYGIRRIFTHLMDGNATDQIIETIRKETPDLVVCGARGLSPLSQLAFGSVSTRVAHSCPVTCITVH